MLDAIHEPKDIKGLSAGELISLAEEVRSFLIDNISKTGGHIGANLGVVELTIAVHYVFTPAEDTLLFDVGHQGYTHKLLTGRKTMFPTLNTFGGMSRFLSSKESIFDELDASHGGTAISIGAGMAYGNKINKSGSVVIAVVGDGAFVEGMSFEGLNYATEKDVPLIVVLNDNGMSIPKNVGGVSKLFGGAEWKKNSEAFFTGMGFHYIAVEDGHDLPLLISSFKKAHALAGMGSVIVHVKTEKGRGLELAKTHPYKMHFSMPFDPCTGEGCSPVAPGISYSTLAGETLYKALRDDGEIMVLTPATPYASGIERCMKDFPANVLDVGMAEQHCLGMAAGLAMKGKKVFACFQATFLQRAMDQLFHDICFMKLPVTIISARSGFSGYDSPTHHGIYDLSYLRCMPNLNIFYAGTSSDLQTIIEKRAARAENPLLVLHPYENIWQQEKDYLPIEDDDIFGPAKIFDGEDGFIFSVGNRLETAVQLRKLLRGRGLDFGVLNIRWINPLPKDQLIRIMERVEKIITLEENVRRAGVGSGIAELIADHGLADKLFISAIEDEFVPAGDKDTLSRLTGIDADAVFEKVISKWGI